METLIAWFPKVGKGTVESPFIPGHCEDCAVIGGSCITETDTHMLYEVDGHPRTLAHLRSQPDVQVITEREALKYREG